MGAKSAIEWTDATWNPVTGCTKVSPGCKYCYAERPTAHLQATGNPRDQQGFTVTLQCMWTNTQGKCGCRNAVWTQVS